MKPSDFAETFPGTDLDPTIWITGYLPAWSSKAAAAATYRVSDGELRVSIPPEHPRWCPDLHETPLRVSGVQSGNWLSPIAPKACRYWSSSVEFRSNRTTIQEKAFRTRREQP